ncbi:ATP-binding protein [Aquabacterium sp.]|uniref:ATP-binding protein n=1 Tax=Aquabacterium sp. TaxID=1872578 RepID=UPI0035B3800E
MSSIDLSGLLARAEAVLDRLAAVLPAPGQSAINAPDWAASVAFRYRKRGGPLGGLGLLDPVRHVGRIRYEDLQEVDSQKERFARNLAQFVAGRPANNVLLSGARGTGKSSLVKAGLQAHAEQGLRLIEVDKTDMIDLPDLIELVSGRPERFIIYCDDLSFEDGEPGYKALKSILDGTVSASGDNVLIVATSNRRHLLPEYHSDNQTYKHTADGELHPGEVVEEKISLSERFGLWISFYPFSQDEYLAIVAQWLKHFGVAETGWDHARAEALIWALERGSRSGRVAYQFARDYAGRSHG